MFTGVFSHVYIIYFSVHGETPMEGSRAADSNHNKQILMNSTIAYDGVYHTPGGNIRGSQSIFYHPVCYTPGV